MLVKGFNALQVCCARLVKEDAGFGCVRAGCPGGREALLVDNGKIRAVVGYVECRANGLQEHRAGPQYQYGLIWSYRR
jgi:hypothetical protein